LKRSKKLTYWRYSTFILSILGTLFLLHGCAVQQKESTTLYPVKKIIVKNPAEKLLANAKQALLKDEFNQAELFLERALRLEPRSAKLWHTMGQVKFEQQHHAQTVQFCLKSNSLARKDPQLIQKNWSLLEKAYLRMGETEKATEVRRQFLAP